MVDEEVGSVRTRVWLVASLCRLHLAPHLQQGLYRQPGGVIAVRSLLKRRKCVRIILVEVSAHLIGGDGDGGDQGVVVQLLQLRRRSRGLTEGSQLKIGGLHQLVTWEK